MAIEGIVTNADRLVTVRVAGLVQPAAANAVVDSDGRFQVLPGQGGVLVRPRIGDPAGGWASDHLEVGASVAHPDHAANRALQILACVGNEARVLEGPATGAKGTVVGKHGSTLVAFPPEALARLGPGERVVIEAVGVGLEIEGEPDVAFHSCAPSALPVFLSGRHANGRLRTEVVAGVPPEAAAAGIGMPVDHLNLDLQVDRLPASTLAASLRLGDLVALEDHDHRYGRQVREGWVTIGAICHGRSASGGHGFGMVTLLTAPRERLSIELSPHASLTALLAEGGGP